MGNTADTNYAMIKAQQLIATTAEFHTTATTSTSGQPRPKRGVASTPSNRPYKAIVVVMLRGGADTYNMIVPEVCKGKNKVGQTVREQYDAERGIIGFTENDRTLIIDVDGQPCEKFAIHKRLSFFMNMCVFNEPVTKQDFEAKTI